MSSINASSSLILTASCYGTKVQKLSKDVADGLIAYNDEVASRKTAEARAASDTPDTVRSIINAPRAQQESLSVNIEGQYLSPSALKLIDITEEGLKQLTEDYENVVQQLEVKDQTCTALIQEHEVIYQKLLAQHKVNESLNQTLKIERQTTLTEKKLALFERGLRELELLFDMTRMQFEAQKKSVTAEIFEALKKSLISEKKLEENLSLSLLKFAEPEFKSQFQSSPSVIKRYEAIIEKFEVLQQQQKALTLEKKALIQKNEVMRQKSLALHRENENLKQALTTEF